MDFSTDKIPTLIAAPVDEAVPKAVKKTYRHIGRETQIHGAAKLERFGQKIELTEDIGNEYMRGCGSAEGWRGSVAILPEEDFAELGFSADHLIKYSAPASHLGAPEDFLEKKKAAFERLQELRESLEG